MVNQQVESLENILEKQIHFKRAQMMCSFSFKRILGRNLIAFLFVFCQA
ncbi:hypothetical protein [Bacillus paramycoides]|nr:hypothetical protein [Bacillus paramycoides]MED1556391.1 hypothetical protein [Bacillus paramycoides]